MDPTVEAIYRAALKAVREIPGSEARVATLNWLKGWRVRTNQTTR